MSQHRTRLAGSCSAGQSGCLIRIQVATRFAQCEALEAGTFERKSPLLSFGRKGELRRKALRKCGALRSAPHFLCAVLRSLQKRSTPLNDVPQIVGSTQVSRAAPEEGLEPPTR